MNALEIILKSRKASIKKLVEAISALDTAIGSCSLTVKPVYENEKAVKVARLKKLKEECEALEGELERLRGPELPLKPGAKR